MHDSFGLRAPLLVIIDVRSGSRRRRFTQSRRRRSFAGDFTPNDKPFDRFTSPRSSLACFIREFANFLDSIEGYDGSFNEPKFLSNGIDFGWRERSESSLISVETMKMETCEFRRITENVLLERVVA